MRSNQYFIILIAMPIITAMAMSSCTHNTADIPAPEVSFSTDIVPIFTTSCALGANCHSGSKNSGDNVNLDSNAAYASLKAKQLVLIKYPTSSILYTEINSGIMPKAPYTPLSAVAIKKVLDWIKQGAKNN